MLRHTGPYALAEAEVGLQHARMPYQAAGVNFGKLTVADLGDVVENVAPVLGSSSISLSGDSSFIVRTKPAHSMLSHHMLNDPDFSLQHGSGPRKTLLVNSRRTSSVKVAASRIPLLASHGSPVLDDGALKDQLPGDVGLGRGCTQHRLSAGTYCGQER